MISPARMIHVWLGACLRSTHWNVGGTKQARALLTQADHGTVLALWHRSLTLAPALWFWARAIEPRVKLRVLISRNADGRLIADAIRPWEIIGIHGSTSRKGKDKGGAAALRVALRELKQGAFVAITPDGPRGPAEEVQPGILVLSRISRRPIIPLGMACNSIRLPSWDGLTFPLPFGRGSVVVGEPLIEPDTETLRVALNAVAKQAEANVRNQNLSVMDRLWGGVGSLLAPALTIMLRVRLKRGRELPDRLRERMGLGGGHRPKGTLLWIHAASVGETLCARPLLDDLLKKRPDLHVLFTTATVTGAEIVSRHPEFGRRVSHRFIPHDVPRWFGRFLKRWQPDGAVFVESELWPGIIAACYRKAIPVMLVNGRLSDRSARRWKKAASLTGRMFSRLSWAAARGPEDAAHFRSLGTQAVYEDGDLKQDAPPLSCDFAELERLQAVIGNRPVFVAASTHPGEEELVLAAAALAREKQPDLLTILIPRHPKRGEELASRFDLPRRSVGHEPNNKTHGWIADTLGELGLFYRLANCCFLGNSLAGKGGGHNPFEPLRLGVPTATGPLMENWREAVSLLHDYLHIVKDIDSLSQWITGPHVTPSPAVLQRSVVSRLSPRILETLER
ncbi:3-deoxy-D-manno-octulosonic-acid transferase [Gluconobacter cerinus]|uniref:glycosyltransferase N-terminal domain-containing protein n=1 Tax=Gluconobacter cerinus TaxID=38307 RepID=UPI002227C396|nr:glycosyltransferase N-terminal domain-containing protein [Gluconobacter cerinus]MCW2264420.1 3-deoxy-D-manno-octulosonic-acid transferase [Gluconobacter cerinus]